MIIVREISCISQSDYLNIFQRIMYVGGIENGKRWRMPQWQVIKAIENKTYSFYIIRGKESIDVVVAVSRQYMHKYIKTSEDGETPDTLLELSSCP